MKEGLAAAPNKQVFHIGEVVVLVVLMRVFISFLLFTAYCRKGARYNAESLICLREAAFCLSPSLKAPSWNEELHHTRRRPSYHTVFVLVDKTIDDIYRVVI
jgi:hypothetical protein